MKTIHALGNVSEEGLFVLLRELEQASCEDRVVRIMFKPEDYVSFCNNCIDPEKILEIPQLNEYYSSLNGVLARDRYQYFALFRGLVEKAGLRPNSIEKLNTGQVIYRFDREQKTL